jgi:hypothetical protein
MHNTRDRPAHHVLQLLLLLLLLRNCLCVPAAGVAVLWGG